MNLLIEKLGCCHLFSFIRKLVRFGVLIFTLLLLILGLSVFLRLFLSLSLLGYLLLFVDIELVVGYMESHLAQHVSLGALVSTTSDSK